MQQSPQPRTPRPMANLVEECITQHKTLQSEIEALSTTLDESIGPAARERLTRIKDLAAGHAQSLKCLEQWSAQGQHSEDSYISGRTTPFDADHSARRLPGIEPRASPPKSERLCELMHKAIDTTELFEHILEYLPNSTLLRATRVSRRFQDVIQASVRLKRKLGFEADNSGYFSFPTAGFKALGDAHRREFIVDGLSASMPMRHGRTIEALCRFSSLSPPEMKDPAPVVYLDVRFRSAIPNLPSKIASMLICQPPIQEMRVSTNCCDNPVVYLTASGEQVHKLFARHDAPGLTLGDVHHAANRLWNEHRNCPHARSLDYGSDGFVDVDITFETSVEVQSDDPHLILRRAIAAHLERQEKEERLLQSYIASKRHAIVSGTTFPTMEEYKASLGNQQVAE